MLIKIAFKTTNKPPCTGTVRYLTKTRSKRGSITDMEIAKHKDNPLHFSPEDLDGGVTTDLEPVTGLLTLLRTVNLDKDKVILLTSKQEHDYVNT